MKNLFERRVPQILGLYIGATWMMIEIGDWMTDRFQLAPNLTSYIFVGMLALIPAVVVIAWFHGAPGKDEWTRVEKTVLPLNLLVAAVAVVYFAGPLQQVAATEIREVVDETGQVQTFEVALDQYHRRLSVFFLDNKTGEDELDWLSFGLPVMLAHDLNHETPLVSAATPLSSNYLKSELKRRGFSEARGAPRALLLDLARDRRSDALLSGELQLQDGNPVVAVSLIDVNSGATLLAIEEQADDWMATADRVSLAVQAALDLEGEDIGENDPLTDSLSGSLEAVRLFVEGLRAVQFENDFPAGIASLQQATTVDPSFAEAYKLLAEVQFMSGASQDALTTVQQASTHDYRLSQQSRFEMRAMAYQYEGKNEAALRVLEMWTEVQPRNPEAFDLLGRVLMVQGTRHAEARRAYERLLDLNPGAHDTYLKLSQVERARGDLEAAADFARQFLAHRPDDPDAQLALASISFAGGDFESARSAYRDAAILGADPVATELGLAKVDMRAGEVAAGEQRLKALLQRNLTASMRVQVMNVQYEALYVQGRLREALDLLARMDEVAKEFLPPVLRIVQIGATIAGTQVLLGEFDEARATIENMRRQMQPPFDAYLDFSSLGIEQEAGNKEAYMVALEKAEAFYAASQNEALKPFLLWGQAHAALWNNERARASDLLSKALEAYEQSFVKTVSESAVNLETKLDLVRMMIRLDALGKAEAELEEMHKRAPAVGTIRHAMALLLIKQGELDAARQQLETALEIWARADDDYLRYQEARALLASLDSQAG